MSTPRVAAGATSSLRFVVRRAVADRALLAPAWLLVLAATTLLATSVLHAEVARRDGLLRALRAVPAAERAITVHATLARDRLATDVRLVEDRLHEATGAFAGTTSVTTIIRSDAWALPSRAGEAGEAGEAETPDLTLFVDLAAVRDGAELAAGRWPEADRTPLEAVLTEPGAAAMGASAGDTLALVARRDGHMLEVTVVGIVRLADPRDARWQGEPMLAAGVIEGAIFRNLGPLLAQRDDLVERTLGGPTVVTWTAIPGPGGIEAPDLVPTAAHVDALRGTLGVSLATSSVRVETGLPTALRGVDASLVAGASGLVLLDLQLAILAAYGLLLIGGLLLEERRQETALLRSRGANGLALTRWAVLEGVLIVASAAALGLALAVALVGLGPRIGILGDATTPAPRVDLAAVLITATAAVAALAGFLLPTVASVGPLAAARRAIGRQVSLGPAQRMGVDLALVALAVLALWQLREYGALAAPDLRGSLGADPVLVAAPAIAMLAGAVIALRLLPLAASIGERLVRPARGLLVPLGARQLARQPGRYSRTALLLVLGGAISVFGGAYGATWSTSQTDQVDQATGADLRVEIADPRAEAWAIDARLAEVTGLAGRTPVHAEAFDLGPAGRGTLLALRPEDGVLVRLRDDRVAGSGSVAGSDPVDGAGPVSQAFAGLVAARPAVTGLALPAGTAALRVAFAATLEPRITDEQPFPLDLRYPGASVAVVVRDGRGHVARFASGRIALEAMPATLAIPLGAPGGTGGQGTTGGQGGTGARLWVAGPVELLAIEIVLQLPDATAAVGAIELLGVATSDDGTAAPTADTWTDVAAAPGRTWTGVTRQPELGAPVAIQAAAPGRVVLAPTAAILGPSPVRFGFRAPGLDAVAPLDVPALTAASLQASQGVGVGEVATVSEQFGDPRRLLVTGTLTGFPTIARGRTFAVADFPTLALSDYLAHGRILRPGAWWASLDPDADPDAVAAAIAGGAVAAAVSTRAAVLDARLGDPVTGSLRTALGLASIAALAFATIGFLVTAAVGTRERVPDLAILRALGVARGRLAAWLAAEQGLLLVAGFGLGAALGVALAAAVLPTITLGTGAELADPPARVVIPVDGLATLAGLGTALLVATAVILRRAVGRSDIAATLRVTDR